jgi:Cu-Zn family superoxide dismutase
MRRARTLALLFMAGASSILWPALVGAQAPPVAAAQLHDATGRLIATATFRQAADQVLITFTFPDRTALTGTHAIQIHTVGRCDPPDFASAGGIFNPFGKQHGLNNSGGPMAGDLLNLTVGPTGLVAYNTSAAQVRLSPGAASLLRPGGTALVIFAQPDDDQTQPEGNAGARIACGVIADAPSAPVSGGHPDLPTAVLIAALGVLLIGAGVVLRKDPSNRERAALAGR